MSDYFAKGQFLQCCQCSSFFDDEDKHPRLLPCLHSVCYQCLQAKSSTTKSIVCSHCGERHKIASNDLYGFIRNDTLGGILNLIQLQKGFSSKKLNCQECEQKSPANFHCVDCTKNLCPECHSFHKRSKPSHKTLELKNLPISEDNIRRLNIRQKCKVHGHNDEDLKFFCKDCNVAICNICNGTIHKDSTVHRTSLIYDVHQQKLSEFVNEKSSMKNKIDAVEKTIGLITSEIAEVDSTSQKATDDIIHAVNKAHDFLDQRRSELLNQVKQYKNTQKRTLMEQKINLENIKQSIESVCSFIDALSTAEFSAMLNISTTLSTRLNSIKQTRVDSKPCLKAVISFTPYGLGRESFEVGKLQHSAVYGLKAEVIQPKIVYVGAKLTIMIKLRDFEEKEVNADGITPSVDIACTDGQIIYSALPCTLQEDGTWCCELKKPISKPGNYEINIYIRGEKLVTEGSLLVVESIPVESSAQVPVKEKKKYHKNFVEDMDQKTFSGKDAELLKFAFKKELDEIKEIEGTCTVLEVEEPEKQLIVYASAKMISKLEGWLQNKLYKKGVAGSDYDYDYNCSSKQAFKSSTNYIDTSDYRRRVGGLEFSQPSLAFKNPEVAISAEERYNTGDEWNTEHLRVGKKVACRRQSSFVEHRAKSRKPHFDKQSPSVKFEFETRRMKIKVYKQKITKLKVDVIVSTTSENLEHFGGVAQAIAKEGGQELQDECRKIIRHQGRIKVTKNCVTCAGELPCHRVIHTVCPKWQNYVDKSQCLKDLCDTVVNILDTTDTHILGGKKTLAMPAIGSGQQGIPKEKCAESYINAIYMYSQEYRESSIEEFHIVDIKDDVLDLIEPAHARYNSTKNPRSFHTLLLPDDW